MVSAPAESRNDSRVLPLSRSRTLLNHLQTKWAAIILQSTNVMDSFRKMLEYRMLVAKKEASGGIQSTLVNLGFLLYFSPADFNSRAEVLCFLIEEVLQLA